MVLPLILGKMAKDIIDGTLAGSQMSGIALTGGFIAAFVSGVLACTWMVSLVRRSKLRFFAYYCILLALAVITIYYLKQ